MKVSGTIRVPGDKSISHRVLMLSALADGTSRVRGLLASADVYSTASVLRSLGVSLPRISSAEMVVTGVGRHGLHASAAGLDCGNSGTTARLMAGVLAASPFKSRVEGDASLSRRPMRRVAKPLEAMGARIAFDRDDGLPMTIHGGSLKGLSWVAESASAQVKSAILLAGFLADVPVEVHEGEATRDHTERMLRARGVDVRTEGSTVSLLPAAGLAAVDTDVPGDPSSAAFFAALAGLAQGGSLTIHGVCTNPTRVGAFRVLARMGVRVSYADAVEAAGEPVASLVVAPDRLVATTIAPDEIPSLIDELPVLACVAARAAGETRVTGAMELRVKESDRVAAIVSNLRAVGAEAEELPDGFVVRGSDRPYRGRVKTYGDHRIAMAFGVLGALDGNFIEVDDRACAGVSYPSFWSDLARARS